MALKKITENPKITDTILIEITTPDTYGCLSSNPYKVDNLIIYYVERDFLGKNYGSYTKVTTTSNVQEEVKAAQKNYCNSPTEENLNKLINLETEELSGSQYNTFYYKDRILVETVGKEGYPAWIGTDLENSSLILEEEDSDGNEQFGHFSYEWNPNGKIREGDYFVCWTWTPLVNGEKLSAHIQFTVEGDQTLVTTLPTHQTPNNKYEIVLERYLPEVYKYTLSVDDQTPIVLDKLNKSIAKGFTFLEDMANQIIDLFDANVLHESMLVYLSNFFGLKLRSSDPTLWRRQIKESVMLFKQKGTLNGLKSAFSQSGMTLNNWTQYWQLVSPYTWTESFKAVDSPTFNLSKGNIVLPINEDNFGLWIKRSGEEEYEEISKDSVTFDYLPDGTLTMTWIGDELSASPIELYAGDYIKVMYQYAEIIDFSQQTLENYIRNLDLMDQRDENDQEFPPKNWNIRLISPDDPLFDILIPVRHPFHDPIMFGYIRTEFAYSENIYNMEEYNGSTRPSYDPCFIGKEFIDPCGSCLSSSYSVDISVQELSNDRMLEAQDVLREYTPFHMRVHTLNFAGEVVEYIEPPIEDITALITTSFVESVLSGNANPFFNRIMQGGLTNWVIDRSDLAEKSTVIDSLSGTAYNIAVKLVSPDFILSDLGLIEENHIMEILSPSGNAGTYSIANPDGHIALVTSSVNEPVDESAFTFNLSNVLYGNTNTSITQADEFKFSDDEFDFAEMGVKTQWDVENTPNYSGGSWKISIPAYSMTPYEIKDIINGILILDGDSNLPVTNTSNITYSIYNDDDELIDSNNEGKLVVNRKAFVELNDLLLTSSEYIKIGDYLYYDGIEYLISSFVGNDFYINDYTDGDVAGATVQTRRRLVQNALGYFGYYGLTITTASNHESELEIINGENPPDASLQKDDSHFKENFIFEIDGEYYKIISIDGDQVILNGKEQSWTTLDNGGTGVTYSVLHLENQEINVKFTVFDQLNRNGKDPVIQEIYSDIDMNTAIVALSTPPSGGMEENIGQEEGINFTIEMDDGQIYEGNI